MSHTMKYNITRRDFMNGVAVGVGTALLAPYDVFAQAQAGATTDNYPPIRTGMRGNHPGSFEASHALAWSGSKPAKYQKLDEHYDLVIVGAGVSGLAAARFYQQRMGNDAKILLLDNHDDFGGHAKRNEFHENGRMLLGVGGSVNLESPGDYSAVAKGVLDDVGIDLEAMKTNIGDFAILSSDSGTALALPGAEGHVSVVGEWSKFMLGIGDYQSAIKALPIPEAEQNKLIELFGGKVDYLSDLSQSEKQNYVESVIYSQFLNDKVGLAEETISIFYPVPKLIYGR